MGVESVALDIYGWMTHPEFLYLGMKRGTNAMLRFRHTNFSRASSPTGLSGKRAAINKSKFHSNPASSGEF
jgi:hypothetical protein